MKKTDENEKKKDIEDSLRALVAVIYSKCKGAYGSEIGYEGQFDEEIREVAGAIVGHDKS